MAYKVDFFGVETTCYGELLQSSNFEVVCEDEDDDGIWCDANPSGDDWVDWDDVVRTLQRYFGSNIVEITAV
jgi:hypothetical protein